MLSRLENFYFINNKNTVNDVVLGRRLYWQNVVVVDDGSTDTGYLSIVLRHIT